MSLEKLMAILGKGKKITIEAATDAITSAKNLGEDAFQGEP